jgi:hypothetical protein
VFLGTRQDVHRLFGLSPVALLRLLPRIAQLLIVVFSCSNMVV